jgi:hypothetical protein
MIAGRGILALATCAALCPQTMLLAQTRQVPVMPGQPQTVPVLTRVVPDSAPAGPDYPVQITLHGTGFAPTGNSIAFGPVTIKDLPSSDGTTITLMVPKEMVSTGEVPPMVLFAGTYPITVTTKFGSSNILLFRMTRGI